MKPGLFLFFRSFLTQHANFYTIRQIRCSKNSKRRHCDLHCKVKSDKKPFLALQSNADFYCSLPKHATHTHTHTHTVVSLTKICLNSDKSAHWGYGGAAGHPHTLTWSHHLRRDYFSCMKLFFCLNHDKAIPQNTNEHKYYIYIQFILKICFFTKTIN
ncbi:hypothetical protein KOW79_016492 [Hemibagrus wyckioides]|uniref:Uncharacterized protein n=1 Tax=Hemibagrus wyckioides TaxID=337641 RepID=A0A9D3NFH3_9TELE|nr:hypothetical protein KOW79_016492 [Hemibagrus wyckioides]